MLGRGHCRTNHDSADYLKRIAAWSRELTSAKSTSRAAGIVEKSYRAN